MRNTSGDCAAACQERDEAIAAIKRAEADNAALLQALKAACDPHESVSCEARCTCDVEALIVADHPGAALLERMRALEVIAGPHMPCVCGEPRRAHDVDGTRRQEFRDGGGVLWGYGEMLCAGFRESLKPKTK